MTLLISPESFVMLSSCVILQSEIIKNPFFTAFHKHNELSDYQTIISMTALSTSSLSTSSLSTSSLENLSYSKCMYKVYLHYVESEKERWERRKLGVVDGWDLSIRVVVRRRMTRGSIPPNLSDTHCDVLGWEACHSPSWYVPQILIDLL